MHVYMLVYGNLIPKSKQYSTVARNIGCILYLLIAEYSVFFYIKHKARILFFYFLKSFQYFIGEFVVWSRGK